MTTVVGLDLSLTATGICYADGSTRTIKTKQDHGDRRLLHIAAAVAEAIDPDTTLAVVEDLPVHAMAAGITAMVHGVVRSVLLENNIPYALIPAASLKAYATGSGAATKIQMASAASKRMGVVLEFADDNECDAWWLRTAGLDWLGEPLFNLPASQREHLTGLNRKGKPKVKWPTMPKAVA